MSLLSKARSREDRSLTRSTDLEVNRQLKPDRELGQLRGDSDLGAQLACGRLGNLDFCTPGRQGSLVVGFLHLLQVCLPGERAGLGRSERGEVRVRVPGGRPTA